MKEHTNLINVNIVRPRFRAEWQQGGRRVLACRCRKGGGVNCIAFNLCQ